MVEGKRATTYNLTNMKASVYNLNNESVGEIDLPDEIFAQKWNPDLVHQVLVGMAANRRHPWAHTKGRGEVRGGGAKPWRQKGTGRARHGSRRSPLWVGGGVTFGPDKAKNYRVKINKKMARAALRSALSKKMSDGEVKIIDDLKTDWQKTKQWAMALRALSIFNALLVPAGDNKLIYRTCRNLPKIKCLNVASLNTEDVLKYQNLLIDKQAVSEIK